MITFDPVRGGLVYIQDTAIRGALAAPLSEYHISSDRDDGLDGTGAPWDPLNGSTQPRFDEAMAGLPPSTVIYLGTGEFLTNPLTRAWQPLSNWTIKGTGWHFTTLKAVAVPTGGAYLSVIGVDNGYASGVLSDNVTISDLTVDGNGAVIAAAAPVASGGEANLKVGLISLFGSNNVIERVHGKNQYGSEANDSECFGIRLAGPADAVNTSNNSIRFCHNELPRGSYNTPYALHGGGGVMSASEVYYCKGFGTNNGTRSPFLSGGVNLENVLNVSVTHCYFEDCLAVVYHDTGTADGVRVTHNTGIRCWMGVGFISDALTKNIHVYDNYLTIQTRLTGGRSYGITIGNTHYDNIGCHIERNTVIKVSGGTGTNEVAGIGVFGTRFHNSTIRFNTVDSDYNFALDSPGLIKEGNLHSDGTTISDIPDSSTNTDTVDALTTGSLRFQGTSNVNTDSVIYVWADSFVIAAGDKLEYEVLMDSSCPAFTLYANLRDGSGTDIGESILFDQRNLSYIGNIARLAKDKWYWRQFDLTPFAGQTAATMNFGLIGYEFGGTYEPLGTYLYYLRHVRVVDSTGKTKKSYYTDEARNVPFLGSLSGITGNAVLSNYGGKIGGVPAAIALANPLATRATLSEAATLTLAVGSNQDSTASGTLATISFSGSPDENTLTTVLRLIVTGGPYTLTIPTSRRIGEAGTVTSLVLQNGNHELSWVYNDSIWWLADTADSPTPTYTVATLPASPSFGDQALVTDGDASLAWGATVVHSGGGATKYLVWFNGVSWTVLGK